MRRIALTGLGSLVAAGGIALAQPPAPPADAPAPSAAPTPVEAPAAPIAPESVPTPETAPTNGQPTPDPGSNADVYNSDGGGGGTLPISGNPAAVNIFTGTGKLGELLGIDKESGVRIGGLWLGDASGVPVGGLQPGRWGLNSLAVIDLSVDTEKSVGWDGGLFGIQFLQYNGQPTNALAGVVQGFDSVNSVPPLNRSELYQLWFRQKLFDDKLSVRVGKMVPTYDFNNVLRPVPTQDSASAIPAVSGLIFTPIFVNPTLLGKVPGYYNSATGVTTTVTPTDNHYFSYGVYDGNIAAGTQTGLTGPQFNGYYFNIAEMGQSWRLGDQKKPGNAAIGGWYQTGQLRAFNGAQVHGANGLYGFGSQRLWFRNPGIDNSGVSGYFQVGANNTNTSFVRQYYGAGLTAFGLTPGRPSDSMGCGFAWGVLNTDPGADAPFHSDDLRSNELLLQWYYQMFVRPGVFFQPTVTYIPNPGQNPDIPGAFAATVRLTVLF